MYPEKIPASKPSSSSPSKSTSDTHEKAETSSSDDDGHFEPDHLESIPDEDELGQDTGHVPIRDKQSQTLVNQKPSPGSGSEAPSMEKASSPTPSTGSSTSYAPSSAGTSRATPVVGPDGLRSDWSHLPSDLQFYLSYFYNSMTSLHYNLKTDPDNFFKTYFLDAALRNDALLNAVVGFGAYQYMLDMGVGKIQDFLQYYNKAVSILLRSLKIGERHNVGTILTVLQLATVEVVASNHTHYPVLMFCRNIWATGSIYSVIRKPLPKFWLNSTLRKPS